MICRVKLIYLWWVSHCEVHLLRKTCLDRSTIVKMESLPQEDELHQPTFRLV
uniref:Uncharacterized protein n=1 Tax=Solanum lycopersicum TaxID=4081 RepID=A0A3Q7EDI8_SOLLC